MTKQIALTQGKFAIVDDDDYERASQHRWSCKKAPRTAYATRWITINGKETSQMLHRFILNALPHRLVDHINGNGLDCRKSNLRLCSNAQNSMNRRRVSKSHYKGIRKVINRWQAELQVNGKRVHIGSFISPEQAARAYDIEARKQFGEFARTNFPV